MKPAPWSLIEHWISRSDRFFVKKLSRNDASWADDRNKHQAGFYIPNTLRESGFFPEFQQHATKAHIFRATFPVLWPQVDERKVSNLSHYSNKGTECHLTVPPRSVFSHLTPASWLICGLLDEPVDDARYWCIVIDSAANEAELLETGLDLPASFQAAEFQPSALQGGFNLAEAEALRLIEALRKAIHDNTLEAFLRASKIPDPLTIAREAQAAFLESRGLKNLDPFSMACPGDAIMEISRDIEFRIYKRHELRLRAAEIARAQLAVPGDEAEFAVRGFPSLYGIFLSTSQQRKTRAGRSFETHVATVLTDGNVLFQEQAVTGGRRPDFVLPDSVSLLGGTMPEAFVLSCKTTLKERWKQVTKEKFDAPIFLATVDDRVPASAIADMEAFGVTLVVPEALKDSDEAFYKGRRNVISFKELFEGEIRKARPVLIRLHRTTGANTDLFA